METSDLLRLCGINDIVVSRETVWAVGVLKFMGADNYVLKAKKVEFTLRRNKTAPGFALVFKKLPHFTVGQFFGKSKFTTTIHDVVLVTESFELPLASMRPGMYPQVLRNEDELVVI